MDKRVLRNNAPALKGFWAGALPEGKAPLGEFEYMLIKTNFMTVDLPICGKMVVENGRLSFRHKFNEAKEVFSTHSSHVLTVESESHDNADLLRLLLIELKKRKNNNYQTTEVTKKIKAELRNFNAVTGTWK